MSSAMPRSCRSCRSRPRAWPALSPRLDGSRCTARWAGSTLARSEPSTTRCTSRVAMQSMATRPSLPIRPATAVCASRCGWRRRCTGPFRTARRSTCTSVAAVCLALLAGCGATPRDVPYTNLTRRAGPLEFTRIRRELFRDRAKLLDVLERNNPGRRISLPSIDFGRREIYLVAAGPRSSSGYELQVVRVQDLGDHVVVVVHERTPSLGEAVQARVTYP